MVPNSFVSSLSMCLFCACTFPVETDPTKVCSGKGAVTLWASPASEENQKISSPCPQDAEKPESKWSGCRVNWKMLPCSNIVWRQFRVLGWVFCCYLIFKLKIRAWDPIAVGNLFLKTRPGSTSSRGEMYSYSLPVHDCSLINLSLFTAPFCYQEHQEFSSSCYCGDWFVVLFCLF